MFLKIITILFFVGTSFSDFQFNCPKGWFLYGKVVYKINFNESAMCLICKKNSFTYHPFDIVDFCIFKKNGFEKQEKYLLNPLSCTPPTTYQQPFPSKECPNTQTPFCGAQILSSGSFNNSIEKTEFLPCNDSNLYSNEKKRQGAVV